MSYINIYWEELSNDQAVFELFIYVFLCQKSSSKKYLTVTWQFSFHFILNEVQYDIFAWPIVKLPWG